MYYDPTNLGFFTGGGMFPGGGIALGPLITAGVQAGLQYTQMRRAHDREKRAQRRDFAIRQSAIESQALTEKEALATNIEIEKLRAAATREAAKQAGIFGLSQAKTLAIGGVATIAVMGVIVLLAKRRKSRKRKQV